MGPTLRKDQLGIDTQSVQRTSGGPGPHTASLKVIYSPIEPQLNPIGIYEYLPQKSGRSRHAPHATAEHRPSVQPYVSKRRKHARLTMSPARAPSSASVAAACQHDSLQAGPALLPS